MIGQVQQQLRHTGQDEICSSIPSKIDLMPRTGRLCQRSATGRSLPLNKTVLMLQLCGLSFAPVVAVSHTHLRNKLKGSVELHQSKF